MGLNKPREIEIKVSLDTILEAAEDMTMEELEVLKERCEDCMQFLMNARAREHDKK